MTVEELIGKLQRCPKGASVEDVMGESVDLVWVHENSNRVIIEGEVDRPEIIGDGWKEIV